MYPTTSRVAKMLHALHVLDAELAARARARDCEHCGGPLHVADYPRKPRGGRWPVSEEMSIRRGLCCGREGCRRRARVPSALFLGRRVYVGVVVVLGAVLQHGVTARRVSRLGRDLWIDRRTLARWRRWWLEAFPQTPAYVALRAVIVPTFDDVTLPLSLIGRFAGSDSPEQASALLRHPAMLEEAL